MKADTKDKLVALIRETMQSDINEIKMEQVVLNHKQQYLTPHRDLEVLEPTLKFPTALISNTSYKLVRDSLNRDKNGYLSFDELSRKVQRVIFDTYYCGKRVHEDMQWMNIFQTLCLTSRLFTAKMKNNANLHGIWYVQTNKGTRYHPELIKHLVGVYSESLESQPKEENKLDFLLI